MYVWVCANGHGCPWRAGDGPECPGAGVKVCCEPPDIGAEGEPRSSASAPNHGVVSPGPTALFTLAGPWGIVCHSMAVTFSSRRCHRSVLLPCGFWGLNTEYRSWPKSPLYTKPSKPAQWPLTLLRSLGNTIAVPRDPHLFV